MANTLPECTIAIPHPGLSAELLSRHDFRFLLNTALYAATKSGIDPEDENDLPSLTDAPSQGTL